MVPFCPHLLQNLSPIAGTRSSRIDTFAILVPFGVFDIYVLSTNPSCPFFGFINFNVFLSSSPVSHDSVPIRLEFSFTSEFNFMTPYSFSVSFPPFVKIEFSFSLHCSGFCGISSSSSSPNASTLSYSAIS